MTTPFDLIGTFAENIALKRSQKSNLEKIGLKITALTLNETEHIVSLKIRMALDFDDSKDQGIDYLCGYILRDEALQQRLHAAIQTKTLHDDEELQVMIREMVRLAYPFVRQHVLNVSADSRFPIVLPLFDLSRLSLKNGLEFKHKSVDPTKVN
jgi:hypothetical protein